MPNVHVYEPALCCNTGVCGEDVDQTPRRVHRRHQAPHRPGRRHRPAQPGQRPLAFAADESVRAFLEVAGSEGLPLTTVDGVTVLTGAYPTRDQLLRYTGLTQAPVVPAGATELTVAGEHRLWPDGLLLIMRLPADPPRFLFFTGKGGVGKTSRRLRHRRHAGRAGQAGAAGQHRPGLQRRPGLRRHHRQHDHRGRRRAGAVGAGDRPRAGGRGLPGADRRPRPRAAARQPSSPRSPSSSPAPAPPRSPRSTSSPRSSPTRTRLRRLRPRPVRHRPHRPHHPAAPAARRSWTDFLDAGKGDASCLGPLAGLDKQRATYAAAVEALDRPRPAPGWCWSPAPQTSALAEIARTYDELARSA